MWELLLALSENPTRENYLDLYRAVVSRPEYDPYSTELNQVIELLQAERASQAGEVLSQAMPNLILSPRAHHIASQVYEKMGDAQAAAAEKALVSVCLRGIMASGEGTPESPYVVARVSDERDLAAYLDHKVEGSSLHARDDRFLDALHLADGEQLWFDITDAYQRLQSQLS